MADADGCDDGYDDNLEDIDDTVINVAEVCPAVVEIVHNQLTTLPQHQQHISFLHLDSWEANFCQSLLSFPSIHDALVVALF